MNSTKSKFLIILFLLMPLKSVLASGSSVIGNGAGLAENTFVYMYSQIKFAVNNFLDLNQKQVSTEHKQLLEKISTLAQNTRHPFKKLIFLSGREVPGFFNTGINEPHRIAKTMLSPEAPIYVNTDHLYDEKGKMLLTEGHIVAILIHELGHQIGEVDHQELDYLGGLIRDSLKDKITSSSIFDSTDGKEIKISTINTENRPYTDISLFWKENQANLSTYVYSKLLGLCAKKSPQSNYVGSRVAFSKMLSQDTEEEIFEVKIIMFTEVYCSDNTTGKMMTTNSILKLKVSDDFSITSELE